MRWSDVEHSQPRLAELGRRRLLAPGVVLVVTIRRDGSARLSPVEPFLMDGDLWLSMMWQSRKAADLLRDPRVLVHSVITNRDGGEGEFKLRGTAQAETDQPTQERYATEVGQQLGWHPQPRPAPDDPEPTPAPADPVPSEPAAATEEKSASPLTPRRLML
jgi:general stress protein 26